MTRTRTLGRETKAPEPFPPSKYSMSREVWEWWDEWDSLESSARGRCFRCVEMVTGLPSSGMEYEVLSVRREMSVARSVAVALPPVVSTMDSVGAGKIGLRVSTPMTEEDMRDSGSSLSTRHDHTPRG